MKFAIMPVNIGVRSAEKIIAFAQKAEQVGLESIWTFEHVVVPVDYKSRYPYSQDGKMDVQPETDFMDPLITLATIAAHTDTLKFGTGVNILPQANPLYLAKQAATLATLSDGRFHLGLGIGWLREEFQAMGAPFARRGARFDDYVTAIRKVWRGEVVEHDSEFLQWSGFKSYPTPPDGTIPIHIGGERGKAFQRIARLGDGWLAPTADPTQLHTHLAAIKRECNEAGRDFDTLEMSCVWMGDAESIAVYEDLGVHRLIAPLPVLGTDPIEGLDRIGNIITSWLETASLDRAG